MTTNTEQISGDVVAGAAPQCKHVYMCMSVRGALKDLMSSRKKGSYFTDDDGKELSRVDAVDALMSDLAKGIETMPMSSKCRSPCQNSEKCKGFDYTKGGGCPGYYTNSDGIHIDAPTNGGAL